jgi:tetratricopeptide (TPR) repeat protein
MGCRPYRKTAPHRRRGNTNFIGVRFGSLYRFQEHSGGGVTSRQCITTFSQIIRLKPEFAEAWNKRAMVYYFTCDLQKSLADCYEVMKRNPNHFGTLSGYGQIYAQLGDFNQALRYFEKAYAINPTMQGVAQMIKDIRRLQEREGAKRT